MIKELIEQFLFPIHALDLPEGSKNRT